MIAVHAVGFGRGRNTLCHVSLAPESTYVMVGDLSDPTGWDKVTCSLCHLEREEDAA